MQGIMFESVDELADQLTDLIAIKLQKRLEGPREQPKLLNKDEARKYLNVSRSKLDAMIADGLPFHKSGRVYRISTNEIDAWLAQQQS